VIRRARPTEAAALTELALRSKAHWGYSAAFLEASRPHVTLTEESLAAAPCFVAEREGRPRGFYRLGGEPPEGWLEDLFVESESIGTGVGRELWDHALETARVQGFRALRIESDPNAEGFYLARGVVRIGEVESAVEAGGMLPLLRVEVPPA
jgi:GNAT superfamily N-acetyltransferase